MTMIVVYIHEWEDLRHIGLRTIEMVEKAGIWDYRINENEFSIRETFQHTVRAIFEDTGNWFLKNSLPYKTTNKPQNDWNQAINRMIKAIKDFQDEDLEKSFTFQWGEKTTIGGAIQQNLFHAIGHLAQLRNWYGIYIRAKTDI